MPTTPSTPASSSAPAAPGLRRAPARGRRPGPPTGGAPVRPDAATPPAASSRRVGRRGPPRPRPPRSAADGGPARIGQALAQLVALAFEHGSPALGRGQPGRELVQATAGPARGRARSELSWPRATVAASSASEQRAAVPPGGEVGLELGGDGLLGPGQLLLLGCQVGELSLGRRQLPGQPGPLRLQGGDHVGIGRGVERLGQRPLALAQHAGQPPGPLDHALGPGQGGGQVGLALGGQLVGGALGVGVELGRAPPAARSSVARCSSAALGALGAGGPRAAAARARRRRARRRAAPRPGRHGSGPPRPGARAAGSGA